MSNSIIHSTVLLVGPIPPPYGGQSVLVKSILESNLSNKFEMIVLNVAHDRPDPFKRAALTIFFLVRLLVLLVSVHRIKLMHIHTSAGTAFYEKNLFSIIGKLFRKKVILHIHGGRFKHFWKKSWILNKYLIKKALDINDSVIVLSQEWKSFFECYVQCRTKIIALPNAIKCGNYGFVKPEAAAVTFLFVGHLKREKGLLDLLEALRILQRTKNLHIKVKLMGVGDTSKNERKIRAAFAEVDMTCVEFLGLLYGEEKWCQFMSADVFILPSHSEDMPISILEAMFCGLPIISTCVGAIPEIIGEGINGFLIKPHDIHALAETMKLVAEEKGLREEIGAANKKKYDDFFSFKSYEKKLEKIYLGVLGY